MTNPSPTELRAPQGALVLEITWDDGVVSTFPHRLLRGFCPCAYCQGHQGPIRWAESAPEKDLPIQDIDEVGNYALRLGWSDGHTTGIYTFRFLRQLHALTELSLDEAKQKEFSR